VKEWEVNRPLPYLHVKMDPVKQREWIDAYSLDTILLQCWNNPDSDAETYCPGRRYIKDKDGLLYFYNADFVPQLCVPQSLVPDVLREAHKSPLESAHGGYKHLWLQLKELYFWPSMRKDIEEYCDSCNICQKIKDCNFKRFGYLRPQDVPTQPYKLVSLDLIGPLPILEEGYTAILVIVNCLSKHAQFVPVDFNMNSQGFGYLFVKHVVCRFGLPNTIYADCNGRWLLDFWSAVATYLKTNMVLLSAQHPQHNGQTKIVNRLVEVMLQAHVAEDQLSWLKWLPLIEHTYNSLIHGSTCYAPFQLLYGFTPRGPLNLANP
jgi:hypothetical protein